MNREKVTVAFKYWIRDHVWVRFNGEVRKEEVASIHIAERLNDGEEVDEPAYFMKGYSTPFFSSDIAWTKEELQK